MDYRGNTAFHESGHLLLSCLLKISFEKHKYVAYISSVEGENSVCHTEAINYKKKSIRYYIRYLLIIYAGLCSEYSNCPNVFAKELKSDIEEIRKIYNLIGIRKRQKQVFTDTIMWLCIRIIENNRVIVNRFANCLYNQNNIKLRDARRICKKFRGKISKSLMNSIRRLKKEYRLTIASTG